MQTKTVQHPFHSMSFDYDETRLWTAGDEKLVKLGLQLCDGVKKMERDAHDLHERYQVHNEQIETVRTALREMTEKLTAARASADHFVESFNIKLPEKLQAFADRTNEANEAIRQYSEKLTRLSMEGDELDALKEIFHNEPGTEELWQEFNRMTAAFGNDDSSFSINYLSFIAAGDSLRDWAFGINNQVDKYLDTCDFVINNYEMLVLETNVQYEAWKEYIRSAKLIMKFSGSPADLSQISCN